MATEFIYLKGKASWVKDKPNEWGKYSFQLHPDNESLEKIRELQSEGIKNVLKKDEDGYYCNFSRPVSIVAKGKVIGLAPPEIWDADGRTPFKESVGNGSDVTVKLEVYSHGTPGGGKAKAARWASMRIDNLVPYVKERDMTIGTEQLSRGLEEQPKPLF